MQHPSTKPHEYQANGSSVIITDNPSCKHNILGGIHGTHAGAHTCGSTHELMQLFSCSYYVSICLAELQWSDGCGAADSSARQHHHLCQSPQEQHHRPGVPGEKYTSAAMMLSHHYPSSELG